MKIISQGAEAIIYKDHNKIIKERIKKSYRIPELDIFLRKTRSRKEAKILSKLENTPKLINFDESNFKIEMEFIDSPTLKDSLLTIKNKKKVFVNLGKEISKIHDNSIIHGDLTTSNILFDKKISFIDFGLSYVSEKIEDKAVDLHLLNQCLNSSYYQFPELFDYILEGYSKSKDSKQVLERLKKVEKRGRYK